MPAIVRAFLFLSQLGYGTTPFSDKAGLKTTLSNPRAVFILTTNNMSELDKGVKDRCILVEMNAAADTDFLPLARRIAADEGVVLSDAQLLAAIAGNAGSFRSVTFAVLRLAKRAKQQLEHEIDMAVESMWRGALK